MPPPLDEPQPQPTVWPDQIIRVDGEYAIIHCWNCRSPLGMTVEQFDNFEELFESFKCVHCETPLFFGEYPT